MTRSRRWLPILAGAALLATAAGLGLWKSGAVEMLGNGGATTASSSGPRSLPVLPGASSTTVRLETGKAGVSGVPNHEEILSRVPAVMKEWRGAILNKDANTVEALDRIFASHPPQFIPALMTSAESDAEQRVRSFSTRVLGKLRASQSAELMRALLKDPSEYVRFNAAWALGELADREAVSGLRRLGRRDPSPNVRRSAEDSLRKIGGG